MDKRTVVRLAGIVTMVAACSGTSPAASPGASTAGVASSGPTDAVVASPSASAALASQPVPSTPGGTAPPTVATPFPTQTPDGAASVWSQDPPTPILIGAAVRVVVGELNIREEPSTSAKRVDTFSADQVILVSGTPPVEADGYVWYAGTGPFGDGAGGLKPLPHDPYAGTDPSYGWFAARRGSTAYVTKVPARCPDVVDVTNLGAMLPAERLACFRGTTIEFEATYGCPMCMAEVFGEFSPAWLVNPNEIHHVTEPGTGLHGLGLNVRFPPHVTDRPETGSIVRIRGHFEDQAADECRITLVPWDSRDMEPDAVPGTVAHLWCRQMFVVETLDVVGIDASYDPDEPM